MDDTIIIFAALAFLSFLSGIAVYLQSLNGKQFNKTQAIGFILHMTILGLGCGLATKKFYEGDSYSLIGLIVLLLLLGKPETIIHFFLKRIGVDLGNNKHEKID